MLSKWISGVIMFSLWLIFLVLCSLNAYNIIDISGGKAC